ncbi:hypothetical protein LMG19087_02147 [Ralstonia wenshanensis]|nr:hypothetical protein LMG19087_02147 [Ralstonia wenshanensis]
MLLRFLACLGFVRAARRLDRQRFARKYNVAVRKRA